MPDLLLAADIGATNTRCRLVDAADLKRGLDEHTYGNGAPVNEAIAAFLARIGERRQLHPRWPSAWPGGSWRGMCA